MRARGGGGVRRATALWGLIAAVVLICGSCSTFGLDEPPPLIRAVANGDLAKVRRLTTEGADPNITFAGSTPLHAASHNGDLHMIELLLDLGADASAIASDHWTVLMSAAIGDGTEGTVALLAQHGADPCAVTSMSDFRGMRASEIAEHRDELAGVTTVVRPGVVAALQTAEASCQ
jgi:hypothetical protein